MPTENNEQERPEHLLPFPIRLTKAQVLRLDELAKLKGVNRSDVARQAVQFYFDYLEKAAKRKFIGR
jgi:metal-responsive CopG/Arc/MetJ family transcriptional regulator